MDCSNKKCLWDSANKVLEIYQGDCLQWCIIHWRLENSQYLHYGVISQGCNICSSAVLLHVGKFLFCSLKIGQFHYIFIFPWQPFFRTIWTTGVSNTGLLFSPVSDNLIFSSSKKAQHSVAPDVWHQDRNCSTTQFKPCCFRRQLNSKYSTQTLSNTHPPVDV